MDDESTSVDRYLLSPAILAAGGVAVVGFSLAAASTHLAIAAGEKPVTLLPASTGGGSFATITLIRGLVVVLVVAAVRRWRPHQLTALLVTTGLFWVVLGAWQAWLMLART